MSKQRCSNCNEYPLCDKCKEPTGRCDNWKRREKEWKILK